MNQEENVVYVSAWAIITMDRWKVKLRVKSEGSLLVAVFKLSSLAVDSGLLGLSGEEGLRGQVGEHTQKGTHQNDQ